MYTIRSQAGSTTSIILIACFVVALIGFSGAIAMMRSNGTDQDKAYQDATIRSYDECVEAGNPIQESDPEKCTTKSGKTFTNLKPGNSKKQF